MGDRDCNRLIRTQGESQTGQGYCTDRRDSVDRQRDVNGPVRARLALFARAIDGVDDPDARFAEPLLRVLAFLGQQAVIGPLPRDGMDKQLVRGLIASLAPRLAFTTTRLDPREEVGRASVRERVWPDV